MKYIYNLILISLFITPATLYSQADSITITHRWEYYDGDTTIENSVDSFSMGIHTGNFTYDANNLPVRRTTYNWGQQGLMDSTIQSYTNGTWVNYHKTSNQYYANDSLQISTKYFYINNSGVFDTNGTRTTITFDSITNTKFVLQEQMNLNSPWAITRRDNYTYDTQNRVTYYLAEFGLNLQPSWDRINYYLPNDSIDYYLYHSYQSGLLHDTDSVVNSYNSNGFLIESTTFNIWNLNQFRPDEMKSYTYDVNNNLLSSCGHLWDPANGWFNFPDTTWNLYNSNNQLIETTTNYDGGAGNHGWYFYDGANRPDSALYIGWPHGGDTHYSYYKMEYPVLNSIDNFNAGNVIDIYPVPGASMIYFNNTNTSHIRQILISDVAGRAIRSLHSNSAITSIDISELAPGIYWVTILTDKEKLSGKFVKE